MAIVENILIEGQQSSDSLTPIVGSLHPVITWEFVQTSADPMQFEYDFRVADNNTSWGEDAFFGNFVSLSNRLISANVYEYNLHNLARGSTYYGQIRVYDLDLVAGEWGKFQFTINSLPIASAAALTPSEPNTSEDIELNYTFSDPDGHEESGTKVRWLNNNIVQPDYDDLKILPASATSVADSWTARIIPSDGINFGGIVETSAVVVVALEENIEEAAIYPSDANIDDILYVSYTITETEYLQLVGAVTISWFLNGVEVEDSNQGCIRLSLSVGDTVYALVSVTDGTSVLAQKRSNTLTIRDVPWHIFDLTVDGLKNPESLNNQTPSLEWKIYKSTSEGFPLFYKVLITKTPSRDGEIYDSGLLQYTKSSFEVPSGILSKGQRYYMHVGVGDTAEFNNDSYARSKISIAGSSWSLNVSNSVGWTIEIRAKITSSSENSNIGLSFHDGKYFGTLLLSKNKISLHSLESVTYNIPDTDQDLNNFKTIKIAVLGKDARVFINNQVIIDEENFITNKSNLKLLEYGDIDGKNDNEGVIEFIKYSTRGAYGLDDTLMDANAFQFHSVVEIEGGSIDYVHENLLSWTPTDSQSSSKLIQFAESGINITLPTVSASLSPITTIFIDGNRNKFIGTSNGVNAIYGERHDPDYEFKTDNADVVITSKDFDRVSSVEASFLSVVEPDDRANWFTLNTTQAATSANIVSDLPQTGTGTEYDPYLGGLQSVLSPGNAVHYYTQRVHGHSWFDNVDNTKGWQIGFSFDLDRLEQDEDFDTNLSSHQGFGIYINDGAYQEILYFYEDRIRFFYANVYVLLNTKLGRDYRIVGKEKNIKIYQKLTDSPTGSFQLLADGNSLFNTPSVLSANSRKPKTIVDSLGFNHAVWHDDGNGRSQILYSVHNGTEWSVPELVSSSIKFFLRDPDISLDSSDRVWVAYEDNSWGNSEISVSVKDSSGWGSKIRITNRDSLKYRPSIEIDSNDDAHVVWEDNRNGHWEIMWASWSDETQHWNSSAHFGDDTSVMSFNSEDIADEYDTASAPLDFKNAKLSFLHPRLWLVCEASFADHTSAIFRGSRNIVLSQWVSSGIPLKDSTGKVVSFNSGETISPLNRNFFNPSIASISTSGFVIVSWEEQPSSSANVSQIWSKTFSSSGNTIVDSTQLTSSSDEQKNSSVGWISNQAVVVFERNNDIVIISYNTSTSSYETDERTIVLDSTKNISYPHVAPSNPTTAVIIVYDFNSPDDFSGIEYVDTSLDEFPVFQLIGDAQITHAETSSGSGITATTFVSDGLVSDLDTKEFSFGDFSENAGLLAHWKDIQFYFGYDAIPYSIAIFNKSTIPSWPDNRTNDLFVDVFGNIVAATFGGLVYYNVSTNVLTKIKGNSLIENKIVTAVEWGKNGIWYVGTTEGGLYTDDAGITWNEFSELSGVVVNSIVANSNGEGIYGTSNGIYIVKPNQQAVHINDRLEFNNIKTVAVDEASIIWAGTDNGLQRIDNLNNVLLFDIDSGMRSSHVNDISVVNKNLRYIATASGIERMHGSSFKNFNVLTDSVKNDNVFSIRYDPSTNSLWAGIQDSLHEITFRDPEHDIISNEIVQYSYLDLLTESGSYDTKNYFVLDADQLQADPQNPIEFNTDSIKITINKNPVSQTCYSINKEGNSILFQTDMLVSDQIEIVASNKLVEFHDFDQSEIEKSVLGSLRSNIVKMGTTSKAQLLALSNAGKNELLLYGGESFLPFTTVLLDRDLPIGCLQKVEILTRAKINFKIIAQDLHSGVQGYVLSNFDNFTSDGETPLEIKALPANGIVSHDLGSGFNNVSDSLTFPVDVTIGVETSAVGSGRTLTSWIDPETSESFLFAGTSSPAVIFRFDPGEDTWTAVSFIQKADKIRKINRMKTVNNVIFVATGSDNISGQVYKSVDGQNFEPISGPVTGNHVLSIAATPAGVVYFGTDDGKIYKYNNEANSLELNFQNIGSAVYGMSIFANTLIASTGNQGKIFSVNLETNDNNIIFNGIEQKITDVHIKDASIVTAAKEGDLFAASGEFTTIYRADLDLYEFSKSYNSFGKTIRKIKDISNDALTEREEGEAVVGEGTSVVASVGDSLFKHLDPSWEFFFRHSEEINDFEEFSSSGINGIFVISNSKITKWTGIFSKKTVYLRIQDKAGNLSAEPDASIVCPEDDLDFCCNYAYAVNVKDLRGFVNAGRIIDVDEYGVISFSFDSSNDRHFYSADRIDQEVGIYTSEIFNGSNSLVSWQSISWTSIEPADTSVGIQVRSASTEDDVLDARWSANLVKNNQGVATINHISDQYIQFRAVLTSSSRGISPTLSSVTIRNLTTNATHFFTTNFVLPSRVRKGVLTANTFIPVSADIIFGINTTNSIDFSDYQTIEQDRLFTTDLKQFGKNLRIGAKIISPPAPQIEPDVSPYDEYGSTVENNKCTVKVEFTNLTGGTSDFHFRVQFYTDSARSQLAHEFFSGNDQTGWTQNLQLGPVFPAIGVTEASGGSRVIYFTPFDNVQTNKKFYLKIHSYDINGQSFDLISESDTYTCLNCAVTFELGLTAEYYRTGLSSLVAVPDFSDFTPNEIITESNINFALKNGGTWTTRSGQSLSGFTDNFAARFRGKINIPIEGEYEFELTSDGGSVLFIDNSIIIDHDGVHGFTERSGLTPTLEVGLHDIEVHYFEDDGVQFGLELRWTIPESNSQIVPSSVLSHAVVDPYCDLQDLPRLNNFSIVFELEGGESVKLNLA